MGRKFNFEVEHMLYFSIDPWFGSHLHVSWVSEALMYVNRCYNWTASHVSQQSLDFTSLFKPHLASAQKWHPSYSHLALLSFTSQTFWSVPNQPFHSPSPSLPPSIFHKRTVTNLFECGLRRGCRDGWADWVGGGGLVSGMVASSFTAYISHTLADCWWKRGGLGEIVYGGMERGGGQCVWIACMSIRMC